MRYFMGIDGGGSGTTACVADEAERILARAIAGPSNPHKVGVKIAERNVLLSARSALRKAALGGHRLDGLCAAIAGVDRPLMRRKFQNVVRNAIPARHYVVTTDGIAALESGVGGSPGVIVISGTGSIAYARTKDGQILRCGGWGTVFDDAGSGYEIGRKAIAAALRDLDGRGERTRLRARVVRALKLRTIADAVGAGLPPHRIAALFPVVEDAARQGDAVARRLCQEAGRDLAELARALLARLKGYSEQSLVICAGGVFKSSLRVRRSFALHLHRSAPHTQIDLLHREPIEGAIALAKAAADGRTLGDIE
jgi:N-acetylglucosamine kinase-like BadF-type ATPase